MPNPHTFTGDPYNSNSAITHLVREGKTNTGYGYIDRLNYTYRGNRLKAVQDSATTLTYNYAFDFKDNANITTEYAYDPNGAIKYDRNKGVTFAEYDFNGMPLRVQFRNGSSTEYVYAFDGTKLRTIHTTAVSGISCNYGTWKRLLSSQVLSRDTTLYFDGFEMHGDGSARFYHETGYLDISADGLTSHHFLVKDHQGNVRVVVTANGTVEQRNNYFAYGGLLNDVTSSTDVQTRKYNGKELDRMHGLDLYDYSARQYDAALGCFTSMDPLCEKYYHISPYAYCAGNPVKYVDPDGRDFRLRIDAGKKVITIEANFEVSEGAEKEFKKAKEFWEDVTTQIGDFTVVFKISDEPDPDGTYLNTFGFGTFSDKQQSGACENGNKINILESNKMATTSAHEMGHALGLLDIRDSGPNDDMSKESLMYYNGGERIGQTISKSEIMEIINIGKNGPQTDPINRVSAGKCRSSVSFYVKRGKIKFN